MNAGTPTKKISYQAQCLTALKSLSRTPFQVRQDDGNHHIEASSPFKTHISSPDPILDVENTYPYESGNGVQKVCSRPSQLKPSGSTISNLTTNTSPGTIRPAGDDPVVYEVPPQSYWEIPRTPVTKPLHATVQYEQVQLPPGQCSTNLTPVRFKTPTHPLSHSNRAPVRKSTQRTTSLDQKESPRCREVTVNKKITAASLNPSEHPFVSPPISVKKELHSVPGMECTENDLAFLKHMKNVKALTKLRAQADDLMKVKRKASEEKDLLEHEAKKIDSDIQAIRSKVLGVTAAVQTLVPIETTGDGKEDLENSVLNHSKLAQLKKLNRHTAVEVERAARKATEKLDQINKMQLKLSGEIRALEESCTVENALLESNLKSTQDELVKAVERNNEVTVQHEAAQGELEFLQTKLAGCKLTETHPAEDEEHKKEKRQKERERIEQKLVTIIRRCELYVERDKKLKELGL